MKNVLFLVLILTTASCQSQTDSSKLKVGGPCEGCEAIYEYGDRYLSYRDTLPKYHETEPKLHVKGTVFQKDGLTPASDVIIYVYQTNRDGLYETKGEEVGWARRHGFIRGWVKTGNDGKYEIYTFRPGAYPGRQIAEHIHITLKEPNFNEYYIDDIVFDDDPLLSSKDRKNFRNRGGSGLVQPKKENGFLVVNRDIILGKNIPGYQ